MVSNGNGSPGAGYGRLIVKPQHDTVQAMSAAGIALPEDSKLRGTICSIGATDARFGDEGHGLCVGDEVAYNPTDVSRNPHPGLIYDGELYEIVWQIDVVAVL